MANMSVRNECNKCGKKFLASCESVCPDCKKADGSYAVLADGWRDARKELPADGEQVIWAVLWKGNCDQGLETPDEYEYIYGRYYEEMGVVKLPFSNKEYKVKWMNYWRRIDPPAKDGSVKL